ncbi:MAG TPA: hypothetical protein PK079_25000 [Leptospiraceae bacterium]|nr:hypothetical protein [Leptospiraceae bacterium]HMW06093.1 hypothetical protein [Leptospiraceae bacterium]HMX30779.1 hypothetical protein [Leptospiraceae bacterium]HMY31755.1 hypothetical protein [Leptospiraceae bacterium]HMZ63086.1 hypothetical protein [Leptospiraceae bacterium]
MAYWQGRLRVQGFKKQRSKTVQPAFLPNLATKFNPFVVSNWLFRNRYMYALANGCLPLGEII